MSDKPKRIQLSRKKGFRLPPNAVNVARPTKWGNPFKVGATTADLSWLWGVNPETECGITVTFDRPLERGTAIQKYKELLGTPAAAWFRRAIKQELRGKDLACWCKPYEMCHADVLLEVANGGVP